MMSKSVLEQELSKINNISDPITAAQVLADAYAVFASDAVASVFITSAGVELGKAAMVQVLNALPGALNSPGQGLTRLPQGVKAFWIAVAGGLATSFPGATAITPPPNTTLQADFVSVAALNKSIPRNKANSIAEISKVFYNNAVIGGVVTIAATPYPIL